MRESFIEEFITVAHSLERKTCWGIAAGANTGSVIDLHMGARLPLPRPIPNPALSEDLRRYYGEFSILVECAWRLDAEEQIICGWGEDFSASGPFSKGLNLILHQVVERVCIWRPALDLSLHFRNSLVLRIFCDQTEQREENDNYVLFSPKYSYVVAARSQVVREMRADPG